MLPQKRMRIFAGPNGSGKTTIFKALLNEEKIGLGVYVNADDIELRLSKSGSLSFSEFQITISDQVIKEFFRNSQFSSLKRNEPDLWQKLNVVDNIFHANAKIDSYLAADLAEFIRQQLLINGISFTYETVMSHDSKIQFMKDALYAGFRVYLYYIATEDPEINISRVNVRVAQKGHNVSPAIIQNRYFKSLNLLKEAVKNTNRAYLFDNSGDKAELVAEITEGDDVRLNNPDNVPNWVATYLLQ